MEEAGLGPAFLFAVATMPSPVTPLSSYKAGCLAKSTHFPLNYNRLAQ